MEVSSVGLEINISLSKSEVSLLKTTTLEGILKFREVGSDRTKLIPFRLNYAAGKSESIVIHQSPEDVYFGNAEGIELTLQDYLYNCLLEEGSCGDRFYKGGKVLIFGS